MARRLFISKATRKWLENLYPSSEKRQRTTDNFTKRSRVMTDADVEKRVREVVVARFYSLAKVKCFLFISRDSCHSTVVIL